MAPAGGRPRAVAHADDQHTPGPDDRLGHQLEHADQDQGGWRLQLANGGVAECGLLVGADGGRSTIRILLTDADVTELNTAYELWISHPDRDHPHVAEMVGPGSLWCLGDELNLAVSNETATAGSG